MSKKIVQERLFIYPKVTFADPVVNKTYYIPFDNTRSSQCRESLDRERFKDRINKTASVLEPVLRLQIKAIKQVKHE